MNVLSLFDGMSCGQIALERAGIEVDTYYAAEIDKYAIEVTQHNYPNTIQMGDVTLWESWDIPWASIDLIIGGSPCFLAGTLVTTNNGLKPIEDIEKGDYVLTHNNHFKEVIVPMMKESDHYNLVKIQGSHELNVTDEHPFYVRTRVKRQYDYHNKEVVHTFSEPYWKDCKDLEKEDFIGIPINNSSVIPTNKNLHFWEFLGRWVADGYSSTANIIGTSETRLRRTYRTVLTSGKHDKEEVIRLFEKVDYTITISEERTSYKYTITNKDLWEYVQMFGRLAHNKEIPQEILDLDKKYLEAFFNGFMSGDGSKVKHGTNKNQFSINTVSEKLAYGLMRIIHKLYGTQPTIVKSIPKKVKMIEGRVVNEKPQYQVKFYKERPKQAQFYEIEGYLWTPFKKRTKIEETVTVYNFEVKEDNSYVVNNLIVHNCQAFSFAGKQLAFNDPRGQLFYTYVDILNNIRKHNPNVKFLLENVKMKSEHLEVINNALGVSPILINSSLVAAQSRTRYYWCNWETTLPNNKNITWGDIKTQEVAHEYSENAICWLASHGIRNNKLLKIWSEKDKAQMVEASHHKKYSSQRFFGIINESPSGSVPTFLKDTPTILINKNGEEFTIIPNSSENTLDVIKDGQITVFANVEEVPEGEFSLRYITPLECERLQTVPDNYTSIVSDTQRYQMIGNGWTVDVIKHLFDDIKMLGEE